MTGNVYLQWTGEGFGKFCVALDTGKVSFGIYSESIIGLAQADFDNLPDEPRRLYAQGLDAGSVARALNPPKTKNRLTAEEIAKLLRVNASKPQ